MLLGAMAKTVCALLCIVSTQSQQMRYACILFVAAAIFYARGSGYDPMQKVQFVSRWCIYLKGPWSSLSKLGTVASESTVQTVPSDDAGLRLPFVGLESGLFYSSSF